MINYQKIRTNKRLKSFKVSQVSYMLTIFCKVGWLELLNVNQIMKTWMQMLNYFSIPNMTLLSFDALGLNYSLRTPYACSFTHQQNSFYIFSQDPLCLHSVFYVKGFFEIYKLEEHTFNIGNISNREEDNTSQLLMWC